MNTLDKTMVNAKIRMDLAKDAVCDKLFAKKMETQILSVR